MHTEEKTSGTMESLCKLVGPVRYVVQVGDKQKQVHLDQIIRGPINDLPPSTLEDVDDIPITLASHDQSDGPTSPPREQTTSARRITRNPVRDRRPPNRLDYK